MNDMILKIENLETHYKRNVENWGGVFGAWTGFGHRFDRLGLT